MFEQTIEKTPTLAENLNSLQDITHSLLRGDSDGEDSVNIMTKLTNVMRSFTDRFTQIQEHVTEDNFESAGQALRAVSGDVKSLVETTKSVKQIDGFDNLPEISFDEGVDVNMINDIPDALLGEQLRPDTIDKIVKFSDRLVTFLEDVVSILRYQAMYYIRILHTF